MSLLVPSPCPLPKQCAERRYKEGYFPFTPHSPKEQESIRMSPSFSFPPPPVPVPEREEEVATSPEEEEEDLGFDEPPSSPPPTQPLDEEAQDIPCSPPPPTYEEAIEQERNEPIPHPHLNINEGKRKRKSSTPTKIELQQMPVKKSGEELIPSVATLLKEDRAAATLLRQHLARPPFKRPQTPPKMQRPAAAAVTPYPVAAAETAADVGRLTLPKKEVYKIDTREQLHQFFEKNTKGPPWMITKTNLKPCTCCIYL